MQNCQINGCDDSNQSVKEYKNFDSAVKIEGNPMCFFPPWFMKFYKGLINTRFAPSPFLSFHLVKFSKKYS